MRRRLYFLLPDIDSAHRTADDLLLARVEDRHMRFLAKRGTDLGELHEAGYFDKTDLVHGAGVGLGLGAAAGMIVGALVVAYPILLQKGIVRQQVAYEMKISESSRKGEMLKLMAERLRM